MNKARCFNLSSMLLIIMACAVTAHAYTSNDEFMVVRQMPSQAMAGETITIEITLNIGAGITDLVKGFYFTDEIPEDLTIETGSYAVTLNGADLSNIIEESGATGDVYPAAVPYRLILETPPDFTAGNTLVGGDELIVTYDITIPSDAALGTVYTFPGYSWVGRISNPLENIFGYEDLPEETLTVISTTTTTSSSTTSTILPQPKTTTTIEQATTTTTIPGCESDDDCNDGNPCTDDSCNAKGLCEYSNNTDPCDDGLFCNGTDTCGDGICFVHSGNPCQEGEECDENNDECLPPLVPCEISIDPETDEVVSGHTVIFTIKETGSCNDPDYEWLVESTIGSDIDQSGNYIAGINYNFLEKATDVIRVVDHANGISGEATITVSWGCCLLQIYGEGSEEIEVLRNFRDNVLDNTPEGREIVRLYYEWSPVIVKAMEGDEEFKKEIKEMIGDFLPLIRASSKIN